MKKEYVISNLEEAEEELARLIQKLKKSKNEQDVNFSDFQVSMQHLYSHLNSAWNGREFDVISNKLTQELFNKFTKLPDDLFDIK